MANSVIGIACLFFTPNIYGNAREKLLRKIEFLCINSKRPISTIRDRTNDFTIFYFRYFGDPLPVVRNIATPSPMRYFEPSYSETDGSSTSRILDMMAAIGKKDTTNAVQIVDAGFSEVEQYSGAELHYCTFNFRKGDFCLRIITIGEYEEGLKSRACYPQRKWR
jgi:hypothetical protein